MSTHKSNTIRLGLFVTISMLIFAISVYYIGNKQNLFGETFQISSVFKNINGLTIGNNVRYAGINIGIVDQIKIINDSMIQVDMELQKEVLPFLKKDAIASIGTDGLVGNMIVNITPGKGLARGVNDGDQIDSYTRIETKDMVHTLGKTTENISLLTLNLLEIAQNINQGQGSIAKMINDSLMAKDIQLTLHNLRQSSQYLNQMSKQLNGIANEVSNGKGLISYLLHDTLFEEQITEASKGLNTLINQRTDPIMTNLETTSLNLATTTEELKSILLELDTKQGLFHTLLEDSEVADDFKQTLRNLNMSTEKLEENMEAMRHHFLFKRYFKKQAKRKKNDAKKLVKD